MTRRTTAALLITTLAIGLGAGVPVASTPASAATPSPLPEHAERLANPTFDASTTGWRATTGTTLALTGAAHTGTAAARLTRPAGGTVMLNDSPDTVGIGAGSNCNASAWVSAPAGHAVRLRVRELGSDGSVLTERIAAGVATGAWQRLAMTHVAGGAAIDFTAWALNMSATDALLVDDASLSCTSPDVLFADGFDGSDGLITNEYAMWNPSSPTAVVSADWEMTSGSLFRREGTGWTGVPDGGSPDADSQPVTGSAVFRLTTRRTDFGAVTVAFGLRVDQLTSTSRTPAVAWDGVHIFLRYQSEEQLYYASVNRRDGAIVVKKKCPGGATNGGTYYTLATAAGSSPIPLGSWQQVAAGVVDNPDGSVTIRVWRGGGQVLETTDRGTGCSALHGTGAVGIRGDNAELRIEDFTVRSA